MTSPSVSLWSGRVPRGWQVEAFAAYLDAQAADRLSGGVFAACTGSGKSIHLAEVVVDLLTRATGSDVIVVTTPTVALVEQLAATLTARIGQSVGVYYTRGKDTAQRVVVTCHPSFGDCLAALSKAGRRVAFWCADECHRTDSPQILQPAATIADVPRIGWSATPYKSDPDPAKGLTLWLHELHRYAADDAIADGALVPWRASGLSNYDARRVNDMAAAADLLKPGDPRRDEIAAAQAEIVDKASLQWVQQQTGPGVVSARHVVDAEAFAKRLEDAGVRALTVHSNQSRDIRAARLEALRQGELDCVVHVQILVEGVDLPWLQWGCLRRPRGRVGFVQEVGRFLRSAPGKAHADLFDPYGLFVQHGISHVSQLAGALVDAVDDVEEDVTAADTVELVDPLTGKVYRVPRLSKARTPVQTIAVAHAVSTSYVSECVSVLRAQGLIEVAQHELGLWRDQPASWKQLTRLENASKRMTMLKRRPEPVAKAVAFAYDLLMQEHATTVRPGLLTTLRKGVLSDFISLDAALKPQFIAANEWDLSSQDATVAALSRWALDSEAVMQAAKDAAKARKVMA